MKSIPVWIDLDAGLDNFVAVVLAHAVKETEILGISTVYGASPLSETSKNCLDVMNILGTAYPVYMGAERPLINDFPAKYNAICKRIPGSFVSASIEPRMIERESAWDALYRCAKENAGELRLVTTGPLTNIATAFLKHPDLPSLLHSVSIKGGAATFGDVTPASEFNIYCDPHAADIVFRAGAKLNVFFREATLEAFFTKEDIDTICYGLSSCADNLIANLQQTYLRARELGYSDVPIGDSCPIIYLFRPEVFTTDDVGIRIETRGTITNGRTVTDAYSDWQYPEKNAIAALGSDRMEFIRTVKEVLCNIS